MIRIIGGGRGLIVFYVKPFYLPYFPWIVAKKQTYSRTYSIDFLYRQYMHIDNFSHLIVSLTSENSCLVIGNFATQGKVHHISGVLFSVSCISWYCTFLYLLIGKNSVDYVWWIVYYLFWSWVIIRCILVWLFPS